MQQSLKNLLRLTSAVAFALLSMAPTVRANVYATNIKLNGTTNNVVISGGQSVSISYILNEPASAGVAIKILSGATVVRTITLVAGNPGTVRGLNTVDWNGQTDSGTSVPSGTYAFSVTAASAGYPEWTQTTSDSNPGNQVYQPWGLAVNQNTNSFYYGRVFVVNSYQPASATNTADLLGFQKLNADGSAADEGIYSDGGYPWTGNFGWSPFRGRVGADDRFYAEDGSGTGVVMSWNQEISTNSILYVLREDNDAEGAGLFSGFYVSGSGADRKIWMTDNGPGSLGVYVWGFQTNGVVATNNIGTQAIPIGGDLTDYPFDIALDKSGKMFVVVQPAAASASRILRFPAYTGTLLSNADWQVDSGIDPQDGYAIAVNPAGTYVAVALNLSRAVSILEAGTGATVTNISLNGNAPHAVAWDNVGNMYTAYDTNTTDVTAESAWQAWSPPGANQATTAGLESIEVQQTQSQVQIVSIVPSGANVIITFTGPASDPPSYYTVLGGSVVTGVTNVIPASITGGGGVYQATVAASSASNFYRIDRSTLPVVTAPQIISIVPSGANVIITFTGPASDPPSYYTVLGGSAVTGVTNVIPAIITGGGGLYQATVVAAGPNAFYRINRSSEPVVAPPVIRSIVPSGANFIISFTGPTSDLPSAYTLLSGSVVSGITNVTGASITGSGGQYQATVAASGPKEFYRIKR